MPGLYPFQRFCFFATRLVDGSGMMTSKIRCAATPHTPRRIEFLFREDGSVSKPPFMSVFSKNPLQKKKHFGGTTLFIPIGYRNCPSVFSPRAQRHPPEKTVHCKSSC